MSAAYRNMETLQAALDWAAERRNMELFTPVGEALSLALTTLRLFVEKIALASTIQT